MGAVCCRAAVIVGGLCAAVYAVDPPYPPSTVIESVTWDFANLVRLAPGSDLWPTTWGRDDNIYTSWGDGGGFHGTNSDGRVRLGFARIVGGPTGFTAVNVWGGKHARNPAQFTGKCSGLISVDGVLYAWINTQIGNPPGHKLAWSTDLGARWSLSDWEFPGTGDFFPKTFLEFGKDNVGARDGYVYWYGGRWIWSQGPEDNVFLGRVPRDRLRDRATYEFFGGLGEGGNPVWTPDVGKRKPVFTDANGVTNAGLAHVVFNRGLNRYILLVGHRPPGEPLMAGVGQLGLFDGPEPWGPWTTVAYYDNWGSLGSGESLGYDVATKWISSDGTTIWVTFSSVNVLDSFNLVKGTVTLR